MGFLSDIADSIFGKDPEVQNQQLPTLTPAQRALLDNLIAGSRSNPDIAAVNRGTQPYKGQLAPDLSGLEKTSLAALEQLAMNAASPGGDSTLQAARGAVERAATGDEAFNMEEFDRFFGESVAAPMLDMFKREVLPELTRRFSGNAAFGSDRREQELLATQDLGKTLTSERAGAAFKTKEAAKDRALTAAGIAPSLTGAQTQQLLSLLAGGGVEREAEGAKLSAAYNEFLRQEESKTKAFDRALATLGIRPFENVTTVDPGQPGLLQSLAPGVGMGLGSQLGKWLSR